MKAAFALYPLIFISFLSTTKKVVAQVEHPQTSKVECIKGPILDTVLKAYTQVFDSLLLHDRYTDIIEISEPLLTGKKLKINELPLPYLIVAYHFIGNEEQSKKLLNQKLSNYNYEELVHLLVSSDIPFIKYFSVNENRQPIITKVINDYKKNVKATDKVAGEQIIRFYINDQIYRKLKYADKEGDKINQEKRFQEFRVQDSMQNAEVCAFYKKSNKYFSVKEVGETVSWYQPIILSHYDNIQLRQTFFKDLLRKAVKEGRMEKTNYVHFILRTESFTNPDFFKNLETRMEEVRKEYELPDYLWNPF